MGRRVAVGRLRESKNKGIIAVGVGQYEEADETKDYTATITMRENGAELGNSPVTITLPAGQDEATSETAADDLFIRKQPLGSSGKVEIVARYRVFNVSGSPTDLYQMGIRLDEGTVNVVNGAVTIKYL